MVAYGVICGREKAKKDGYSIYRVTMSLETCSVCPFYEVCETSRLFANFTKRVILVKGPNGLSEGQKVLVDVKQNPSVLEYFLLFGMPVVGLMTGAYFFGGLGAIAMMIVSFTPAYAYEKLVKEKNMPEVVSVIPEGETKNIRINLNLTGRQDA